MLPPFGQKASFKRFLLIKDCIKGSKISKMHSLTKMTGRGADIKVSTQSSTAVKIATWSERDMLIYNALQRTCDLICKAPERTQSLILIALERINGSIVT